jgi:hypothetical protein
MKNKKFTSILIGCVIALWGIVFYRIYVAMIEKVETTIPTVTTKPVLFKGVNHIEDSVQLNLNYRDPFSPIHSIINMEKEISPSNAVTSQKTPMPKPLVNWQAISYAGYIANANSKQKLVLILMNGQEFMLSEGQTLKGVKLIRYAGDSIKVKYQEQVKFIKLR